MTQAQTLGIPAAGTTTTGSSRSSSVLRRQLPPPSPRRAKPGELGEGHTSGSAHGIVGRIPRSPLEIQSRTRSQSLDGSKPSSREGSLEVAEGCSSSSVVRPMNRSASAYGDGSGGEGEAGSSGGTWGGSSSGGSRSGSEEVNLNLSLSGFPELAFLAQV